MEDSLQDGSLSNDLIPLSKLEDLQNVERHRVLQAKQLTQQMDGIQDANALYQTCFQLLKLGGLEAEIPRLVVFGQQSMGKTTLLDYIMGGPIGFSSTDTGTKQPVVVMLKPTTNAEGRIECTLRGEKIEIHDLQEAMKTIMTSIQTISSEELELEMSVPGAVHAVFVDLPGIKDDSKEGAELTRSVVRNYVRNNPNDLYILVKKASDDPANWPWSLREFILSSPPRGLGLTQRQTIVVGTRAKDFLINEKNDVRTHTQLLERVTKRAVKDSSGQPLPLYLLELFSLSIEEKETLDFPARKAVMYQQIMAGGLECRELLLNSFEGVNAAVRTALLNFFSVDAFKRDLNTKFQALLNDQLASLERRLIRKRTTLQKQLTECEDQLAEQNPQSIREYIKLFLRELTQIITELVTGNYMIIRLPDSGDAFLSEFGGNLADNLEDGHRLALELFPNKDLYNPEFLNHIKAHAENVLERALQMREAARQAAFPVDPSVMQRVNPDPQPDLSGRLQPGQYVRFPIPKDNSQMLGHIQSIISKAEASSPSDEPREQQSQSKPVELCRVKPLLPLASLVSPAYIPPPNYRCWKRIIRSDDWVGLAPIALRHIQLEPTLVVAIEGETVPAATGVVVYVPLSVGNGDLNGTPAEERFVASCRLEEVFCEASDLAVGTANVFEDCSWKNMTTLQRIAGDFAETKLLNQLALTHLGRWLKFHICSLEPDRRFSDHVMLQLMRSVKHVIDKADWEPLVADLLQANVRGSLLQLTRLASCATAVALRRIVKAAVHEVRRQINSGDLTAGLQFLANNAQFVQELDQALEMFCRDRALTCSQTMRDLIFEQTHAIHFEMIEDFFEGCRQFEHDFLNGCHMDDVTRRVKEGLAARKQKLGVTDIYARRTAGMSHDMIYEEVRIQFWVVKMLLSAPLTTKLYMYFVKDIKDKSKHLASDAKFSSSEGDLERVLQEIMLCDNAGIPNARPSPRSDDDLIDHFGLAQNKEKLAEQIRALKRTDEYVRLALEGVAKLRAQIHKQGGVDFLTRLSLATDAAQEHVQNGKALGHFTSSRPQGTSGSISIDELNSIK